MNKVSQKQKERQLLVENALNYVMSDDRGRFFVSEILGELTMSEASAFTGNSETFRNLGQQQVFVSLKQRIIATLGVNGFNAWQTMEREKYERMHEYGR